MLARKSYLVSGLVVGLVVLMSLSPAAAASYTITVTGTTSILTEKSIGAVEGCDRFNAADLADGGFKNYRIYAGTSRLETSDDDGVYGSPTIAQIKANPNLIPWTTWDNAFNRTDGYFWSGTCTGAGGAQVSLAQMLTDLKNNGIAPVVTVRNVDNNNTPVWAQAMNPPNTPEDNNEWWEHVFATVYWVNVRNNLMVDDWQVHNEPDNAGQGWAGTQADYIAFTQTTADAINYVYATYLANRPHRIYAPVSTHANDWITASLQSNDSIVDVVDWHRYGPPASEAVMINGWVSQYNTDGNLEDLMISEWGSYRGKYGFGDAMNYAGYLRDHSTQTTPSQYVARSEVFPFYDWTTSMTGLVAHDGTRRDAFWAFRLMNRGLNGGKQGYAITHNIPSNVTVYAIAAKDQGTGTMYVEVFNRSAQTHTITLDLSAHATTGTVTYREYSTNVKDAVTGTGTLVAGKVTFNIAKDTIIQVIK